MNSSASSSEPRSPAAELPVGQWPVPTSKWGLRITVALWVLWLGFLIWMMILRIQTTPV